MKALLSIPLVIPDPGFNPCYKIGIDRGHRSPITCAPHLIDLTALSRQCSIAHGQQPGITTTRGTEGPDRFIVSPIIGSDDDDHQLSVAGSRGRPGHLPIEQAWAVRPYRL